MMKKIIPYISSLALLGLSIGASAQQQLTCRLADANIFTPGKELNASGIDIVKICEDGTVNYTQQTIFAQGVTDSVNGFTYKWTTHDNIVYNGPNVALTYNTPGIFKTTLTVNDTVNHCSRQHIIKAYVAPKPDIVTSVSRDSICVNDTALIKFSASHGWVKENCAPPVADTTYLPDGNNNIYSSNVYVDCYHPNDTITDGDQVNICVNMEHSYLGDLWVQVKCPNGQTVRIHDYSSGGGTHLGSPGDIPNVPNGIPGVGWTYCFSDLSTMGSWTANLGNLVPNQGNPAGNSLPAATYNPLNSFDGFIGCPYNGPWTLEIKDNIGSDDGYVFWYSVELTGGNPILDSFLPNYNITMVPDSTIVSTSVTGIPYGTELSAIVSPDSIGLKCYNYIVSVDSFPCTWNYNNMNCVYAKELPQIVLYDSICKGFDLFGYSETGTYVDTFVADNGCDSLRILHLFVRPEAEVVNIGADITVCQYDSVRLEPQVLPYRADYQYEWIPTTGLDNPTAPNVLFIADEPIDYVLAVTPPLGCTKYDTIKINVYPGDFLKLNFTDTAICPDISLQIQASGAETYKWTPAIGLSNDSIANPIAFPMSDKVYTLIGVDKNNCKDTATVAIQVYPEALLEIPDTVVLYPGQSYQIEPNGNGLYYKWTPDFGLSNPNIANPVLTTDVETRYFVTVTTENGCIVRDSMDVLIGQSKIEMPNAFNPNNSTFKPVVRGTSKLITFEIFNRWGELIYQSTDINEGWNGRKGDVAQPGGVYVYRIIAETETGKRYDLTGNVTLIR